MSLAERIYYGSLSSSYMCIKSGKFDLIVENREYYTRYCLRSWYTGQPILWHEVRTPEPVPIRPAQIIHARHIPWFMWIYYGIRDWHRQRLASRELEEWGKKDEARREAIRKAVKERGLGRLGGRYNR